MRVIARAPARIDFGGGWTDVPPICTEESGTVCAAAIARYATVTLEPAAQRHLELPMEPIVRAALRRSGLYDVHATIANDFPVGAGLGGSSAAGVALQAAIAAWKGEFVEPLELAARSRAVEVEDMGIAGGWQDHCAAAIGGVLAMRFGVGRPDVQRLALADDVLRALEQRCIIVYTGESRLSSRTITGVVDAWRQSAGTRALLTHMRDLAGQMNDALARGDVDAIAPLVRAHWERQRALHEEIPTERIDQLIARAAAAGARGYKALGASGGGCVLLIAADADGADDIRRAATPLGEVLPFTISRTGVQITVGR